jgi:hypothetical protein
MILVEFFHPTLKDKKGYPDSFKQWYTHAGIASAEIREYKRKGYKVKLHNQTESSSASDSNLVSSRHGK